jgi:hypothetical protein
MRLAGHVARIDRKEFMKNIGRKAEEESLGRPRHRWVHNIEIDHKERGWGSMDWIDLAQDRNQN